MYVLDLLYSANTQGWAQTRVINDRISRNNVIYYTDIAEDYKAYIIDGSVGINIYDTLIPLKFRDIKYKFNWLYVNRFTEEEANIRDNAINIASLLNKYHNSVTDDVNILFVNIPDDINPEIYNDYINLLTNEDTFKDVYKKVPEAVQDLYNKVPYVTSYGEREHKANVFISKDDKVILVLYRSYNYNLQMESSGFFTLTLGIIPVLIDNIKQQLSDQEKEYFKVLVKQSQLKRRDKNKLFEAATEFLETTEYQDKLKEIVFNTFLNDYLSRRKHKLEEIIASTNYELNSNLETYTKLYTQLKDYQKRLIFLDEDAEEAVATIKEIITKPFIHTYKMDESYIYFAIKTNLEYCMEDEAQLIIDRWYSNNTIDKYQKQLLLDIFINKTLHLKTLAKFKFKYQLIPNSNTGVDIIDRSNMININYSAEHLFPQPHIIGYSCTGNYERILKKAVIDQDLFTFINTALTSTKSLNFSDGTVIDSFRRNLFSDRCQEEFLVDEEGNYYSPEKYINKLKEKDAQELPLTDTIEEV